MDYVPVVGGKVLDRQLHQRAAQVGVNHAAAHVLLVFDRHKVAELRDRPDHQHVQVEVISAVLVQGQETEAVAQVGDVKRPFPPVGAVEPFLQQSSGNKLVQTDGGKSDVVVLFFELLNSFGQHLAFGFDSFRLTMASIVHHEKDVDIQSWIVKGQRLDGAGLADVQTSAAGCFQEKGVLPVGVVEGEKWNRIRAVPGAIGPAANIDQPTGDHTAPTAVDSLGLLLLLGAGHQPLMTKSQQLLIGRLRPQQEQLGEIHKVQSTACQYEPCK